MDAKRQINERRWDGRGTGGAGPRVSPRLHIGVSLHVSCGVHVRREHTSANGACHPEVLRRIRSKRAPAPPGPSDDSPEEERATCGLLYFPARLIDPVAKD